MDNRQGALIDLIEGSISEQEGVLRSAGAEFLELVCSQQPWGALGLLVALPDSVLYAPQKAGFGVLYWLCCIKNSAVSVLIEALHQAHPELFEEFTVDGGIIESTKKVTDSAVGSLSVLTMGATVSSVVAKSEQQKHPIYWCIEHQNALALKSLLKVGVVSSYFYFYEALRCEAFECARVLEEYLNVGARKKSVLWVKCYENYAQSALNKVYSLKKEYEKKGADSAHILVLLDYIRSLEEKELLEETLTASATIVSKDRTARL